MINKFKKKQIKNDNHSDFSLDALEFFNKSLEWLCALALALMFFYHSPKETIKVFFQIIKENKETDKKT